MITNNLEISQKGVARPCCIYEGDFGNIENYDEIEKTQKLVANTLTVNHKECNRCWDHESRGLLSKRLQNAVWESWEILPNILEINLSNLCNLACTTCGPDASSIWASKLKIVSENSHIKKTLDERISEYLTLIEKRKINKIVLLGGEPTIHPETFRLLDRLIELKLNSSIEISIITNGYEIIDFFNKYHSYFKFSIALSVDGIESVFEYMRHGHNWDSFLRNLIELGNIQKINKNFLITMTYSYSICNLFHYSKFKQWYDNHLSSYITCTDLHLNRVDGPWSLSPKVANEKLKTLLHEDMKNKVEIFTDKDIITRILKSRDEPRCISYLDYNLDPLDLENIKNIDIDTVNEVA